MEVRTMNKNYTNNDSFSKPNMVYFDQEVPPLGKYGMMCRTYLKETFPAKYNWMVWQDTLWPHLNQIDADADELFRTIVDQMAKARDVNEQLKAENQWR